MVKTGEAGGSAAIWFLGLALGLGTIGFSQGDLSFEDRMAQREFLKAKHLEQDKKIEAAREAYSAFLRQCPYSPWSAEAEYRLGRLADTPDAAIRHYRGVYEKHPKDKWADRALGQAGYLYLLQGKYAEAEEALRMFIHRYPQSPKLGLTYYYLGLCLLARRDAAAASQELLKAQEKAGNEELANLVLQARSNAVFLEGDYAACLNLCEEIRARFPKSPMDHLTLHRMAQCHRQLGNSMSFLRLQKELRDTYPQSIEAQLSEADSLRTQANRPVGSGIAPQH